ncbi:hypothetical protein [Actinocatenispora comari]|uniref:Uncharacterized protein n=1 Tax=Actinocatenispora comari TaxID=2807577 RepID=A0A8J4EN56_9ACTN|nr:hypothetical protein [Actinocatenispora comari]GIL29935.1 hypothetical protein NUM_51890 [Actinocatenispora comari]
MSDEAVEALLWPPELGGRAGGPYLQLGTDGALILTVASAALLMGVDPDEMARVHEAHVEDTCLVEDVRFPPGWMAQGKATIARVSEQYGAETLIEVLLILLAEREQSARAEG